MSSRRASLRFVSTATAAQLILACAHTSSATNKSAALPSSFEIGETPPPEYAELSNVVAFVEGPGDGKGRDAHPEGEGACAQRTDGAIYCWHARVGFITAPDGGDGLLAELQTWPTARRKHVASHWGGGEMNGECTRDARGRVQCRGTTYLSLGMRQAHPSSDGNWRDVPALKDATFIGTDEYCVWGLARNGIAVQDCVREGGTYTVCLSADGACIGSKRNSYPVLDSTIERAISWYRFGRPLRKLVAAAVALADDGHLLAINNQAVVEWPGLYRDVVLDETQEEYGIIFYALQTNGHVSALFFDGRGGDPSVVPILVRAGQPFRDASPRRPR